MDLPRLQRYTDGSGVGSTPRDKIGSALTSPFPKAIDIENDIIKQGFVDTFLRDLLRELKRRLSETECDPLYKEYP